MSIRTIVIVVVVVMAFLGGIVWQSQMQRTQQAPAPAAGTEQGMPPAGGEGGPSGQMMGQQVAPPPADAELGIAWKVPASWSTLDARSMRVATYGITARGGDSEGAECAVFYFGPNQGGGAEENLDRWVGQFEHPSQPERTTGEVAGMKLWRVHVLGDYLAPSGPMMQSTGTKNGFALLGAIVEGPNGRVFFKLTGPKKTVDAAKGEFEDMLKSVHKS